MSATVMSAINVMCSDAKSQAVKDLALKYGFDAEEAQRFLNHENLVEEPKEKKVKEKKEKKVKEPKEKEPKEKEPKEKEPKEKEPKEKEPKEKEPIEKVEEKSEEKSDEDKPKRKPTAYSLFSKDQRPVARLALEADLNEGEKLSGPVIQKELAKMWKALPDEERATWKEAASSDSD